MPFILATWRELGVAKDEVPRWLRSWIIVRWFYLSMFLLFVLSRLGASGLYFYAVSEKQWASQVQKLDPNSFVSFHVLGVFFTGLNVMLMFLLAWWYCHDADRCKQPTPGISSESTHPKSGDATNDPTLAHAIGQSD